MRDQVILKCTECGMENYITSRNKKKKTEKLELKKYCFKGRKHTIHREVK